jgi:hypothetical protein
MQMVTMGIQNMQLGQPTIPQAHRRTMWLVASASLSTTSRIAELSFQNAFHLSIALIVRYQDKGMLLDRHLPPASFLEVWTTCTIDTSSCKCLVN